MATMYAAPARQTILRGVPVKLPAEAGIKGSCSRSGAGGGKTIVAIGAAKGTIAAGASTTFTFTIREAGHIDRLFLSAVQDVAGALANLSSLTVTSIVYDNDNLTSGDVPAAMFELNASESPIFAHLVEVNHELQITVRNDDPAASATLNCGFSVA